MTAPVEDEQIWKEFDVLERELGGDVEFFLGHIRHSRSQHLRRALCRAVTAYLEGMTSWMARYTILFYHPGQLFDSERQTLERRLSALERTFHAIDLFTARSGATSPLGRRSDGWRRLDKLIRIRNRILHPGRASDVLISDAELESVRRTAENVICLVSDTLHRSSRALLRRSEAVLQALEKRDHAQKASCNEHGESALVGNRTSVAPLR